VATFRCVAVEARGLYGSIAVARSECDATALNAKLV
jgi:hypothetical protein